MCKHMPVWRATSVYHSLLHLGATRKGQPLRGTLLPVCTRVLSLDETSALLKVQNMALGIATLIQPITLR